MTNSTVLHLALQTMIVGAKLAAPILLTSLLIGFAISLLQSVTQIQEVTLTFVPKMVGVALALLVAGHWMLATLVTYTEQLYASIPALLKAA